MRIKTLVDITMNGQKRFLWMASHGLLKGMDDRKYLQKLYYAKMGRVLNLNEPSTFNEKMQWLKLNDRKPIYTQMVDKYEVKKFVGERIGYEHVIPSLGIYKRYDDIDFSRLPGRFVLKCTHDSGGLIIVRDKRKMDHAAAKKKLERSLKRNYFYYGREWPYKDVQPRILAEKYVEDAAMAELNVYKIFCFAGKPELIQVIQGDKTSHESIDYFDTGWRMMDLRQNFPNSLSHLKRPNNLEEMLSLAEKLSGGHPFLRIDFYSVEEKVFFSEFTFYSDSGMAEFNPEDWDERLGRLIVLPREFGGGSCR